MASVKLTVSLDDAYDTRGPSEAIIEITDGAVVITPVGYGDNNSPDGKGVPIIFEFRDGVPYVAIWADINQEDSTHVISLEGAAESKRRQEED